MTFRCSAAAEERGDPLEGTASTVRAFLLVECPGPWGVDAIRDSRLPPAVKTYLTGLAGVRPLLIRGQHGHGTRIFLSRDGAVRAARLKQPAELLDVDLEQDLTASDDELYLVCTHGKHDACCAERGRPVWQALHALAPEQTWQVSHIGGDRFAANVLVLPHGLYYGRVQPSDAPRLLDGLDLSRLRGRSTYPFVVQAAEIFLRRELGVLRPEPLTLVSHEGGLVVFEVDGQVWPVLVADEGIEPTRLTCRSVHDSPAWAFRRTSDG